ncbi:MAG TPA: 3' terminal RNA ribose 2'-O-methyltransferase Hen1 [Chthoniobacteraceae bacterium]|nr:3' terminal RNA ribose 2'-O-methyltransferase Hen1 [Chthoniobacteraceae bacterium]
MHLTLRTTTRPATDLGYLLHKHPDRMQKFSLSFGTARVYYPEAGEAACAATLFVSVDPVALVRTRQGPGGEDGSLDQYVNDRPYAASSFLSVAIAEVFGSALGGRCRDRPEAVAKPLALEASISVVACRHGGELLHRLFEPLGYEVGTERLPLDPQFPQWGESRYYSLKLKGTLPLQRLLSHLYVLIPVLDNNKHYWIGESEVEKLLAKGEGWLALHPEKDLIAQRYLRYQRSLVHSALDRLISDEADGSGESEEPAGDEATAEKQASLNEQRLDTVLATLKETGAARVLDLGCGEGKLLRLLLAEKQFSEIVGMDVSHRALEIARRNLRYERLPERQKNRLKLLHGSLIYRDERLSGFDAAALVEVIEHLDPPRLRAFERVVFEFAKPKSVVVTTPNAEYNVRWPTLGENALRHRDHRFEWSRAEFRAWAEEVAGRFGYTARFLPVGPEDEEVGSPTQMGVFQRCG